MLKSDLWKGYPFLFLTEQKLNVIGMSRQIFLKKGRVKYVGRDNEYVSMFDSKLNNKFQVLSSIVSEVSLLSVISDNVMK